MFRTTISRSSRSAELTRRPLAGRGGRAGRRLER
jgi:hypothetical protein